jgi:hypothetical protein
MARRAGRTPCGYLFTANEQALPEDGPQSTTQAGTLSRILRHDRQTGAQSEFAYRTDPIFLGGDGELGVVDLAALSPAELLVMERGYVSGIGNSTRIYRVNTALAPDVLTKDRLAAQTPVLDKALFLDLATLPDVAFPPSRQPQPTRILANFEGLALGPRPQPGQRLLFLISDDNANATQVSRLLVLSAAGL